MRLHHTLILATLFAADGFTQLQGPLFFDGTVPVHRQGQQLDLAWAGGANFIQMGRLDLNGDGLKEVFLFDRSGNKVITLLNNGGGINGYSVTREFDHVYPFNELHDWALLGDYDNDGRVDIFSYSQAGFSVYRNISDANGPAFEQVVYRVNSNYVASNGDPVIANLYVSQVDLPGIADVDGDGDLDVLTFSLLGSYIEYHKNLSMELFGTADSLKFELRNKCWGFFSENFSDNSVALNSPCNFNVPAPEFPHGPDRPGILLPEEDRAHAGSTVTPLDLQGDGVMDLLLGDISFNNIVALFNGGTIDSAMMVQVDNAFPSYDQPVDLPIFPGAFHVDVDDDGKRDLVLSPNSTSLANSHESIWYYHNTGTDAAPIFEFQQEDLFQDRMIDFGEGAFPVLFDHDQDGLMDLVVANHGYFEAGNVYAGKLALLRNVGTATAPAFDLVTDDYMGLSQSGIGTAMYPAFGDVDGDGDHDMLIGDLQGRLHFYRNTGSGTAEFTLVQNNVTDAGGEVIDVGQFATPQLFDLDGDGLLDLLIGERNGNLNYYHNSGTNTVPSWTLIDENLGDVSTVEWWNITGHSVPFMFNGDAGKEIILGSESGWLHHYGDIDGNLEGAWTLIDSTFLDIHDGQRTGVCLYDFTGDGALDMVIGNYRGGLSFWRSDDNTSVDQAEGGDQQHTFSLYPNPAVEEVQLVAHVPLDRNSYWSLTNSMGQMVKTLKAVADRNSMSLAGLSPGIYHVRLEGTGSTATQRLVVIGNNGR